MFFDCMISVFSDDDDINNVFMGLPINDSKICEVHYKIRVDSPASVIQFRTEVCSVEVGLMQTSTFIF